MHAAKFWTSKMWGRVEVLAVTWNVIVWYQIEATGESSWHLLGGTVRSNGGMIIIKEKGKKESMVKILQSFMILNKNSQSCTINRCLRCLAMPHSNFARLCIKEAKLCLPWSHIGPQEQCSTHLVWALDGGKRLSLRPNYFTVRECPRIKLNMRLADQQFWMFCRRIFFVTTGTRTPDWPAYTLVAMPTAIYILQVK